jgi:hypothetical protein
LKKLFEIKKCFQGFDIKATDNSISPVIKDFNRKSNKYSKNSSIKLTLPSLTSGGTNKIRGYTSAEEMTKQ